MAKEKYNPDKKQIKKATYKLNPEYKGQKVVVNSPKGAIYHLENATQKQFELAYAIKGNEKFIIKS